MIQCKTIDDLEKILSYFIIYFINKYDINDLNQYIYEKITNKKYGKIHLIKEYDNIIIYFKNFILKNHIIFNKTDSNDICCVCFDECMNTLNCGHYICEGCAKSWLKIKNSCPVCRNTDNFKKGYKFTIPINLVNISINRTDNLLNRCFPLIKKKISEKKLKTNLKKYRYFDSIKYKYSYICPNNL